MKFRALGNLDWRMWIRPEVLLPTPNKNLCICGELSPLCSLRESAYCKFKGSFWRAGGARREWRASPPSGAGPPEGGSDSETGSVTARARVGEGPQCVGTGPLKRTQGHTTVTRDLEQGHRCQWKSGSY